MPSTIISFNFFDIYDITQELRHRQASLDVPNCSFEYTVLKLLLQSYQFESLHENDSWRAVAFTCYLLL